MYDNFKEVSEDEFLAHFGVPGMKWGKRKARTDSSSSSGAKPKSKEIKEARKRQQVKIDAINKKGAALVKMKDGKEKVKLMKTIDKDLASLVNNPDTKTASYMTRGEKALAAWTGQGKNATVGLLIADRK